MRHRHYFQLIQMMALFLFALPVPAVAAPEITLLNPIAYRQTVTNSRHQATQLLEALRPYRHQDLNAQVIFLTEQLLDTPYLYDGAMGEGDWQPGSYFYQPNAKHMLQDPVYRFDGFDCQTYVQTQLALLHATTLAQFEENIIKSAYGAAGNPAGNIVRFYNRNNFIDGDWNPINRQQGWLADTTTQGALAPYATSVAATLTRQAWFNHLPAIRVLQSRDGEPMAKRYQTVYNQLPFPHFQQEHIKMTYLPKQALAIKQANGQYRPNAAILDHIPTPAIVEFVRDPRRWTIGGRNIKNLIGSELTVSHFGILFRQTFNRGELIYRKTRCADDTDGEHCLVTPVYCQQNTCTELMFTHATRSYLRDYYWYADTQGEYHCSQTPPPTRNKPYRFCNRVVKEPLFDYLTDYQFGSHWYMQDSSLLGIHIERLL